jgi:hypothetical protein
LLVGAGLARHLWQAVRYEVNDIEPCNILQVHEIHGLRLLFAEYGDEYVTARNFLLTTRLNVENGTLQYSLEPQCGLNIRIVILWKQRRLLLNKLD